MGIHTQARETAYRNGPKAGFALSSSSGAKNNTIWEHIDASVDMLLSAAMRRVLMNGSSSSYFILLYNHRTIHYCRATFWYHALR